ncbi:MAG: hypothetical protein II863_17925 [Kiritimatiellae bacterium]|nr:hypothetical protein [Kiritimatiellia bacterium]
MGDVSNTKSRRKKIHEGEVLGFAKALLDFLNAHYIALTLDDVINWDSVEDYGYCRDASFYSDTIESYCQANRQPVMRLFLDIIDFHCNQTAMPTVFKQPVLFGRLALVTFLRHHRNTTPEKPPWNEFPRNKIAAAIIDNVFPLWFERFKDSSYRGMWEYGEALRLLDGKKYENVIQFALDVWKARLI